MKKIDDIIYKADCDEFLEINDCGVSNCFGCILDGKEYRKFMKKQFGIGDERIDKILGDDKYCDHNCGKKLLFYKKHRIINEVLK